MIPECDNHSLWAWAGSKLAQHRAFWAGEGPSLIFIPTGKMEQYDVAGYAARFENPRLM